jgi:gas vesicle protein
MSNTSDTLLAFLVGATVGGIAALLLAPDKGEVTRKKIQKTFHDLQERGEGAYQELEKSIEGKAKELAQLAKAQGDAVKGAFAEGKSTYLKEIKKNSS